jgi:hypothetical protein
VIPDQPFIHSLSLVRKLRTYGWIAPAEATASSPQDVRFAVPVDRRGRFNDTYSFELFRYARDGKLLGVEEYRAVSNGNHALAATIDDKRLIFREKRSNGRQRSFPYLGKYENPDFLYRLVEVEPEPFELVDELFLASGLVLIGCDPSSHYKGWTAQQDRSAFVIHEVRGGKDGF